MIRIIQMVLCTVLAIQLVSCDDIPYKDIALQVFDTKSRNFEKAIVQSLESTKHFWEDETVKNVFRTSSAIEQYLPFGEAIKTIVAAIADLSKSESDWKPMLTKALEKEQYKAIIMEQIEWFTTKMEAMKKVLPLLDKENEPNKNVRMLHALSLYHDIHKMLEYYRSPFGLFQKYPLVTAPLLIYLGLLTTAFLPLANEIIPSSAKRLPIECDAMDTLKQYRSLVFYARLQKTNLKYLRYFELMKAVAAIDKYGPKSTTLSCQKGCKKKTTHCDPKSGGGPCDRAPAQCQKTCERLGFNDHSHCIKDEYGSEEFETNNSPYCIYDYTALVWNRVAKLFPIQQLSALCKRVRFRETGSGWATISLGTVAAYGSLDGGWKDIPKNGACVTFIKIYINDKIMDQVDVKCDTYVYDADHQFITGKIAKSSKIKIEVLYFVRNGEKMVLRTEGTIDDFIENPYRSSTRVRNGILNENNSINTYVLWTDEFP